MFVDEFAAFLLDEGFKVLRASRDTSKCRIFNSTPQGSHNAFYEVCHGTAARQIQLHWSAHPLKNKGLYTTDPKTGRVILLDNYHGEVTLRQRDTTLTRYTFPEGYPFELDQDSPKLRSPWYDNECARCASAQEIAQELDIDFLGSAYPFFDPRFIRIYKAKFGRECLVRGELTYDPETLQPKAFIPHEKGNLQLWINLDAAGCVGKDLKFAAGVDVSAGVGASNSAISITNRATGEKVAVLLTSNIRPHPFAKLAMAVCWLFNEAFLVWDATGATGTTFTKCVVRHGYTNIYYRRNEKKVTREISKEPGYFLNSVARNVLLENYRESLVDGSFVNPSKSGIDECLQFMRRPDGGIEHAKSTNAEDPAGAKSAHGDEVIADALSNVGVSEMKVVAEAEEPAAQPGSLAYRRRQRAASEAETTVDSLPEGW